MVLSRKEFLLEAERDSILLADIFEQAMEASVMGVLRRGLKVLCFLMQISCTDHDRGFVKYIQTLEIQR